MKMRIVSVEDGIDNVGFRKMSAYARRLNSDTDVYYVPTGNVRGLYRTITMHGTSRQDDKDVRRIAEELADSDIVGFSSMTPYSDTVRKIIGDIREINPKAFIVWGGIHAIIHPEDAILHADAVCTGEGEFAFEQFYRAFCNGHDYSMTPSFWFNVQGNVVKNINLPLQTAAEMDGLPYLIYQDGERIYRKGEGFVPIAVSDFVEFSGLAYNTVWSIGCPLKCTYCGNTKFIEYDKGYRRIRHSAVDYIVNEVKRAVAKHPHLSTIVFHDDSFMALPRKQLHEFAIKFKAEIGLPFAVFGVIPNYVEADKMEILLEAGLNRVRMGIQSGSERILEFYKRPTPVLRIKESTEILNRYRKFMIPPAYDIIVDCPVESRDDTLATLDLIYEMPRPFTLNIHSLRVIPNTDLALDIKALGIDIEGIQSTYLAHIPSLGNALIYVLVMWRIPRSWYEALKRRVQPAHVPQPHYYSAMIVFRFAYLVKRALQHLRFLDFTNLTGQSAYWLWRIGLVGFWQRHLVHHFRAAPRMVDSASAAE